MTKQPQKLPKGVKGQNPDGSYYLEETVKKPCNPNPTYTNSGSVLELLQELEWAGLHTDYDDSWGVLIRACPSCFNAKKHGHKENCKLAAELRHQTGMTTEKEAKILDPWEDPDNQFIEICKECQKITGGGCSGDPIGCAYDALDELKRKVCDVTEGMLGK